MNRVSSTFIVGCLGALGCALAPKALDPLQELGVRDRDSQRTFSMKFERSSNYRIQVARDADGAKRSWLVSPDGTVVFPVGRDSLRVLNLSLMRDYAGSRFPFPGNIPLSFEPGYRDHLEKVWIKKPSSLLAGFMMMQMDEQIAFAVDSLDQALQLDSKETTYRLASKWLYKERASDSTVGITKKEREAFLARLIEDYYSPGVSALRKKYPQALILSQLHRAEDFESRVLRDLTQQYCDVIQLQYPRGSYLFEKSLRKFLSQVTRPVWFRDVPPAKSMEFILPLLRHPQVIGWDWDRSRPWRPHEQEFVDRFEKQLPKILAHLHQ